MAVDIGALLPSWRLAMQAEHKAPRTIQTYTDGVRLFLRWCEATGRPAEITKRNVQTWIAELLGNGAEAATAVTRQKGVRQFAKWLAAEGELDEDPLVGLKRPQQPSKIVEALTDEQLRALVKACQGKALKDRRDEAIVRLFAETGMRATELLSLTIADLDLDQGLVTVRRGKGGKGRVVPFGPQTGATLDRYIRIARREGRATASTDLLWVGTGGRTFGYYGLDDALKRRARIAGITGFHIHLLRHTFATRWKAARGTDDGLMAVAGWSSRAMIDRYSGAAAALRAATEARGLGLGDI